MTSHYGNIESQGLLYNNEWAYCFQKQRDQRALRNWAGGKTMDQAVGSKVTKRDVFHSEIYYNTTEAPEGGG